MSLKSVLNLSSLCWEEVSDKEKREETIFRGTGVKSMTAKRMVKRNEENCIWLWIQRYVDKDQSKLSQPTLCIAESVVCAGSSVLGLGPALTQKPVKVVSLRRVCPHSKAMFKVIVGWNRNHHLCENPVHSNTHL